MNLRSVYKSAISIILVMIFVLSLGLTAFAEEATEYVQDETVYEEINDPGIELSGTGSDEGLADTGLLSTPSFSTIEGSGRNVVFKWKAISGAYRYQLFYYDDTAAKFRKMALTGDTTYTWDGATVGVEYKYTIRCVDSKGEYVSDYNKNGWKFKLLLATPKISKIETVANGINLSWNAVDGAVRYRLFYKNGTSWKKIGDTSSTSYNFTKPPLYATKVIYTIRCISEDLSTWESDFDATGHGYTFGLATPKVKNVVLNDEKGTLDVYWNEIIDAEYYRVFIKNGTGNDWTAIGEVVANANQLTTSFSWSNFTAGQSYTFTLRCVNNFGYFVSDFDSKGYTYTVKINTPKVTSVVKRSNSSVTVGWTSVAGAEKYRLFYKNGTSWKMIADTAATSYTWSSPVVGKAYTYTVRCVNSSGKFSSDYDTVGFTHTLLLDTPKVTGVKATNSTSVTISWGAVTGAKKYRVFYKNGSTWKTIATTTSTSYVWKSPVIGQAYTYTVRCLSEDGKLWTSDYNSSGFVYTLYLDTPKITSCSVVAENKFKISWNKVTGAAKYRVFYYVNSKKHYVKIGDTANTSFNVTAAKLNTTYKLTVRCISADASTWESDYDLNGFSYTFVLDTPKVSKAESQGGSSVKISWGAVTGAVKYAVFRKDDPWKTIGYSTTNSFTWNDAVVNTEYTFTVRCCDSSGKFVSSFDSKGLNYKHQLKTPYITSIISLDEETVKIAWDKVTGAYAYRVFYKSGKSWKAIATTTATKYIWDECTKNKSFTYTVRCVDKEGNFTSSFDSEGFSYTITNVSSAIADVALSEVEYWKSGNHGYASQGSKYTNDLGVALYDWCGYFATYCCKHAGIAMFQNNKTIYGFVGAWKTWGDNNGQWYPVGSKYTPCPGDMVIWGSPSYYQHVTVVVSVDENTHTFYDVGGNEVYYDYYSSVVHKDGPFDYKSSANSLVGFVGTHILG